MYTPQRCSLCFSFNHLIVRLRNIFFATAVRIIFFYAADPRALFSETLKSPIPDVCTRSVSYPLTSALSYAYCRPVSNCSRYKNNHFPSIIDNAAEETPRLLMQSAIVCSRDQCGRGGEGGGGGGGLRRAKRFDWLIHLPISFYRINCIDFLSKTSGFTDHSSCEVTTRNGWTASIESIERRSWIFANM